MKIFPGLKKLLLILHIISGGSIRRANGFDSGKVVFD